MSYSMSRLFTIINRMQSALIRTLGMQRPPEPYLALAGLDVHHIDPRTCRTPSSSISDTLNEIFTDTLWAAVPKSRRSLERRLTRRMGGGKLHYGEHAKLKTNIVSCVECGSWHEIQTICGNCYEKVRAETKAMQEAMSDEAKFYAPHTETAFIYKGEEDDRPKYKGKYIVELDRPRPSWFPRNLMTKVNE